MVVTDIKIRKFFNEGPMKAVVSVTFDGALAVHDVKVINAKDKFFIVMPSRKNPDGTYRDIVHPINSDFRAELEGAVISEKHVAVDGKFITAKGAGVATEFGLAIVSALKGEDTADKIGKAIQMK